MEFALFVYVFFCDENGIMPEYAEDVLEYDYPEAAEFDADTRWEYDEVVYSDNDVFVRVNRDGEYIVHIFAH